MRAPPTGDHPAPPARHARVRGRRGVAAAVLAGALALAAGCAAAQAPLPEQPSYAGGRARIGLALSGGGARGISHIGVIKVLEELRVPVDYVAATSMGSIVGGFYASGMNAAEMEREVRAIDWSRMFSDSPPRADLPVREKDYQAIYPLPVEIGFSDGSFKLFKGAISGANLELWLHQRLIAADDLGSYDELAVPFRAVATDMVSGKEVVFDRGPLYQAIRASMSVPGLFAPFESGGRVYGDGSGDTNSCHSLPTMNSPVPGWRSSSVTISSPLSRPRAPNTVFSPSSWMPRRKRNSPVSGSRLQPVKARATSLMSASLYCPSPRVNSSISSRAKFSFGAPLRFWAPSR